MQSIFQEKDRLDENLFPLYSIFIMEIKRKLISCQLIRIFILELIFLMTISTSYIIISFL